MKTRKIYRTSLDMNEEIVIREDEDGRISVYSRAAGFHGKAKERCIWKQRKVKELRNLLEKKQ